MTPVDRVLARVAHRDRGHSTPCWCFEGSIDNCGYGQIGVRSDGKRTTQKTHRVVYEAMVGPIPDGITIDHVCEVKECCNPAHLEPCTRLENIRRYRERHADELATCKRGHLLSETRRTTAKGVTRCRVCENRRSMDRYWKLKASHNGTITTRGRNDHAGR